ncbi:DUF3108 domain-containing protein [Cesiribacter sp. SM1]|uniref:DUF3108 domain-containing protein n=1 Tax=Cesiribacter sp. SM1 TaxID=2861196 RepID=UPI001CD6D6A6|nr:DUF3108 domain-containing protein [Cesiribacter sp. SM1]
MKKILPILLLPFFLISARSNDGYRLLPSNAFGTGEKLTYRVHYGFVTAGEAELRIDKRVHSINDRPCYKIDVKGRTTGLADKLYGVKNVWGSYMDTAAVVPHQFYRYIREGNYRKNEVVNFKQLNRKAVVSTLSKNGREVESSEVFEVPVYVQDLVSGYYYMRTLDFSKIKQGDVIRVDAFFDKEVYDFKVRFIGREKVKTDLGKLDALVVSPLLPENSLFKGENAVKMWLSDDEHKIPLKIKADMFIGAIEVDIRDFDKGKRK